MAFKGDLPIAALLQQRRDANGNGILDAALRTGAGEAAELPAAADRR